MAGFSVTRAQNGQIVLSLNNLNNYTAKNVGTASGNLDFSLGHTEGTDETVLQIGQGLDMGSLDFEAEATTNNYQINGSNIDADFNKKNTSAYNVQWNAKNSKFDSSKSNSSVIFEATKESSNNVIKTDASANKLLSKYDNLIFDDGNANVYVADADSTTRVETTANSKGAVVEAGNGQNDFYIGGSYGVFSGGANADKYTTSKTADHNMMLGNNGVDTANDYASNSLFIGGAGNDIANIFSKYGVFNLGFNEEGTFNWGNGAVESSVFTGEEQVDSNGKVYKYSDILKLRGWDLENFLENSNIKNNPYYDNIKAEIEAALGK